MTHAVVAHVLVGTSATDAASVGELQGLASSLGAELAFLQMASPSLGPMLTKLSHRGVEEIVLVGVQRGDRGPGVSWLRRIAADWWRDQGAGAPVLRTASSYLEDPSQWDALTDSARPITHPGPGLRSAAWEDVPAHQRQVFVCRGPRCTAAGSEETTAALTTAMMRAGLGDDDALLTQTGCQFPCNQAPVVTVHPDDVWYGSVDAAGAAQIVAEHLARGRPVTDLRLPRTPRRQ